MRPLLIACVLAFPPDNPVGDIQGPPSGFCPAGACSGDLFLADDYHLRLGNTKDAPDAWLEWDTAAATDNLRLVLTDVDGVGTNGFALWWNTGDATTYFGGDADLDTHNIHNIQATDYASPSTITVTGNAATVDLSNGDLQVLDLDAASGSVTVTVSNPTAGQAWALKIIQGAGTHNIGTWSPTPLFAGGASPTITATNDAVDLLSCVYDGASHLCSITQDLQ